MVRYDQLLTKCGKILLSCFPATSGAVFWHHVVEYLLSNVEGRWLDVTMELFTLVILLPAVFYSSSSLENDLWYVFNVWRKFTVFAIFWSS